MPTAVMVTPVRMTEVALSITTELSSFVRCLSHAVLFGVVVVAALAAATVTTLIVAMASPAVILRSAFAGSLNWSWRGRQSRQGSPAS